MKTIDSLLVIALAVGIIVAGYAFMMYLERRGRQHRNSTGMTAAQ